ncbi:hypothetical protein QEH59_02305 [Coraliomargarita sp. SDUM461004]|uniref:Uncharacterized protein n=1 Tax=Thalassobacterium sedimentorum TaxID=3041258 RepID=A0ABU1AH91_9BACT|nr:hypothetical protein [Coraliomargarita sp. SDUM461004]MDQ8193240.1 hypothetical protein [Coraliomargarita sp. SDUM461004]
MRPITFFYLFLLSSLGLFVGCDKETELENLSVPRLMVETRGVNYGAMGGDTLTLPVSGTVISIQANPVVTEFDILNVEMVKVEMGMALLLQVSGQGARDLYRASVANMGSRIVLTVNGNAVGARRIDGAIGDGNFYTFVEVDDEELGQLVLDMKATLAEIQSKK